MYQDVRNENRIKRRGKRKARIKEGGGKTGRGRERSNREEEK